jgi:hypothetical protein
MPGAMRSMSTEPSVEPPIYHDVLYVRIVLLTHAAESIWEKSHLVEGGREKRNSGCPHGIAPVSRFLAKSKQKLARFLSHIVTVESARHLPPAVHHYYSRVRIARGRAAVDYDATRSELN